MTKPIILTGDRTTGPLHIGHYAGSLRNRLKFQDTHEQYLLLADTQALTDNAHNPDKVRRNVIEVALDYLAVGIDPAKTTICLQSHLPALAELSMLYLNFVTVARLERNPTIKDEIRARGFGRDIPAGFLCYPAAQAADITAFKATVVPVGEDQAPLIEQTNEIVRRINSTACKHILPEARAVTPLSAQTTCSAHSAHRDIVFCNYLATASGNIRLWKRFSRFTGALAAGAWARHQGKI